MSKKLEVEVCRDGYKWNMDFINGNPTGPLRKGEQTTKTGTTVTFWANEDIFETTTYSFETLRTRFQQMAFLNKGLTLTLVDERHETKGDEIVGEDDEQSQINLSLIHISEPTRPY